MPIDRPAARRLFTALLLIALSGPVSAAEIRWDDTTAVEADINCDGTPDRARLGYLDNRVRLAVTIGPDGPTQTLDFAVGVSDRQDALCGTEAVLETEAMDYDLVSFFGENPQGFRSSNSCKGLNIKAGQCDAMHIFWNHETNHINWWRL